VQIMERRRFPKGGMLVLANRQLTLDNRADHASSSFTLHHHSRLLELCAMPDDEMNINESLCYYIT
jgi:hypothetical protein